MDQRTPDSRFSRFRNGGLIVLLFTAIIYVTSVISPPALMDDVDGVQAQIARNMLDSGDWVTPTIDGVKYFEKPPMKFWLMAVSYWIFGPYDWAARIPTSLFVILLAWMIYRMARWAIGERAGVYSGLAIGTCLGVWLFTRILIPDIILTLSIGFAMWAMMRALEEDERNPRLWAWGMWAAIGVGTLLKGLIAGVFPVGTALLYLLFTGLWKRRETWKRLHVFSGILLMLVVAAPWHVLATLRNPPYLDFTMKSERGVYRGFFWDYFLNEHILRFLNLRYPHDYDTVPLPLFWLLHFAWFFPWSVYLVQAWRLPYRGSDRAAQLHLLCACWIGVVLGFFSLSTTQEYYSMPAYPAFALLIGSAMATTESKERVWRWSLRVVGVLASLAFLAIAFLLWASRIYPTPGDISQALARHPDAYRLSLGHMGDLTLQSFAYLRQPLAIAGVATLVGAIGALALRGSKAVLAVAAMMVLFFQGARVALIAFEPYLGSRPLAEALNHAPPGGLILDDAYYELSSIIFYTNRKPLILNGRINNLEYGSYAPGAPPVFIDDAAFVNLWKSPDRWYVASENQWEDNPAYPEQNHRLERLIALVGKDALHPIATAGGKTIYVNH